MKSLEQFVGNQAKREMHKEAADVSGFYNDKKRKGRIGNGTRAVREDSRGNFNNYFSKPKRSQSS